MKSIRKAVFKIPLSQAISCIGYSVNIQTAVAAILFFIECPKSIATEVFSGIKAIIKCEVNQTSGFQDIAFKNNCGRTNGRTDGYSERAIPWYVPSFDGRIKRWWSFQIRTLVPYRYRYICTWLYVRMRVFMYICMTEYKNLNLKLVKS